MTFIVEDIARFAINGMYDGRAVANVYDMQIDTTGSLTSRPSAVAGQAELLVSAWDSTILDAVVNDYTFVSVSYVDLDSDQGVTGTVTSGGAVTLPTNGRDSSTQPMPGNVSVLVTKLIAAGRTKRNGRTYICGISEGATDAGSANTMATGTTANWQADVDEFRFLGESIDSGPGEWASKFVVVRILTRSSNGAPLTGDYEVVTSMLVQSRLATQRRRLRG